MRDRHQVILFFIVAATLYGLAFVFLMGGPVD